MNRTSTFFNVPSLLLFIFLCLTATFTAGQQKTLPQESPFVCGTPDTDLSPEILAMMQRSKRMANARVKDDTRYVYRLSVDIDSDTYFEYGGDTVAIQRDVLQSMAVVSRIFETEVNIKVSVVNIHIQKDSLTDPYRGESNIFALLRIARNRLQRTPELPNPYDALIYAPTKQVFGAGGVSFGIGVNVSPLGRISTTAHEIGHDLGSAHTHNCGWEGGPLDYIYPVEGGCYEDAVESKVGTIMSYTSIDNFRFHPQVKGLFRSFAERKLLKVMSSPAKVKLSETYNNPANKPYLAFATVPKADKFIVQTASSVVFDDILSSDTTDIPLMHLSDITDNASLYVRVKALNAFGESDWSNLSEVKNGSGLKTPLPAPGSHLAIREINRQNIQLDFSAVENATGYEVNVDPFFFNYVQTSYSDTFRVATPDFFLERYPYRFSSIRWRVRAVNAIEKSAWSAFQTILPNMKASMFNYIDYAQQGSLPTQFTFGTEFSAPFQTSQYTVREKETGDVIDTYNTDLSDFMESERAIYQPKGLLPDKTYELTTKITNILPDYEYNIPAGLSQTVTTEFNTVEKEHTDLLTYYSQRTGNDVGRNISSVVFSEGYAFITNEQGLTRLDLGTDSTTSFNRFSTNGKISNQVRYSDTDIEGNVWMLTQVSKRSNVDGRFPVSEYEIRKFDSETMQLVKSYNVPTDIVVNFFDTKEMAVSGSQGEIRKLYKITENGLVLSDQFTDNRFRRHRVVDITPRFYWLESTSAGYREVVRLRRDDKSAVSFSQNSSDQISSYFDYVIGEDEKLAISGVRENFRGKALIFNPDPVASFESLELNYTNSIVESMTFDSYNTLFVLSRNLSSSTMRLHVFEDGEQVREIALPEGFRNGQNLDIDNQGNAWVSGAYGINKITICDEASAPSLTYQGGTQTDSLTLFANGCQNASWKFSSENSGFSQFFTSADSLKIKNEESTIKVSCVQDGCVSKQAVAEIGGLATVSLVAASAKKVCPGDSLNLSVELRGLFEKENTLSGVLILDDETYEVGTFTDLNNISIKIPETVESAGEATLRIRSSFPEATSNDFEVSILPRPAISITSDDLICENGELLLSASSADTTVSYMWSVEGSDSPSTASNSLRISSTGTFRLNGTDSEGCTNSVAKTIAYYPVKPAVEITGEEILCEGATLTLSSTASGIAPFTFNWTQNEQLYATTADSALAIQTSGTYSVTATDKNGCLTDVASFTVKRSILPDAVVTVENNASLIPVDGVTVQVSPVAGRTYLWYKNDEPLNAEISNTLTVREPGSYKVQLIEGNCQYTTEAISLALALAIEQINERRPLLLYPNPVSDELIVELEELRMQNYKTLYLYSAAGQLITKYELPVGKNLIIDARPLPAGAYFLKTRPKNQRVLFGRFIKK